MLQYLCAAREAEQQVWPFGSPEVDGVIGHLEAAYVESTSSKWQSHDHSSFTQHPLPLSLPLHHHLPCPPQNNLPVRLYFYPNDCSRTHTRQRV
ncbi:hypothetical protein AB1N83_002306 [Pleurotus pulmonarius]